MRVLVVGAGGMLGQDLVAASGRGGPPTRERSRTR